MKLNTRTPESFLPAICVDLETTVQTDQERGIKDNSPHNPLNQIVSVHWRFIDADGVYSAPKHFVLFHKEVQKQDAADIDISGFVEDLAAANTFVAHNAKYDLAYIQSFFPPEVLSSVPDRIWCTMVTEYILARSVRTPLSLEQTAIRRGVSLKKTDLVSNLFKGGIGFEEMPLDVVVEYADADVLSTCQIFIQQLQEMFAPDNGGLRPVLELSFDMLRFLQHIEDNGICIDLGVLDQVEQEYVQEKAQILGRLEDIARHVMGDTPINLNSGADVSMLIYSRKIVDKALHKQVFNIGTDARGKSLRPPQMSERQFIGHVRSNTEIARKTVAHNCSSCNGFGKIRKTKKDGTPFKKETKCVRCAGAGLIFVQLREVAGLRLSPESAEDASANGFKTDKATIKRLQSKVAYWEDTNPLKEQAQQFLQGLTRLNAINTYLDSFVRNIKHWTREDGLLHAQFNQTVTRTGRLSSSNPNFQNQPKSGKFPVRKCVVSRWQAQGGQIIEADFSGLEFRVAGELSRDPQIIADIFDGKDVHKQTACIINQCSPADVSKDMRQSAKAYTFAPLYGGMGASEPPHVQEYFKEYFNIYERLGAWHKELMTGVLKTGIVRTPSGREFHFPDAHRTRSGRVTNATAIVNYPVQSFATADIVPLACVRALRLFMEEKLHSKIILTVHDSIVVDCYPNEQDRVFHLLYEAMSSGIADDIKNRFGYELCMPLDIEIVCGPNWMETSEVDASIYTNPN
jgi:DNA polymerase I-like protein with 3'-5' exonuclease and polymerase domains